MSGVDTRNKLIGIIKQHQLDNGITKLPIGKLSELAGITRQAFNRYYGDLKDYAKGSQSISKLLVSDCTSLSQLLESKEKRLAQLEFQLIEIQATHKAELAETLNKHITSLMNNDVMIYESGQISATLTSQNNHNAQLIKRVTELEVSNTKLIADATSTYSFNNASNSIKSSKNFIPLEIDIKALCKSYAVSNDFDEYEDAKDAEIQKNIKIIKALPILEKVDVVVFQERYISDFGSFCKTINPRPDHILVVLQLPLYSRAEIQLIIKELTPVASISIYVPYSSSEAVIASKRKFIYRGVPEEELKDADEARVPLMEWGFDSIQVKRIKQGD